MSLSFKNTFLVGAALVAIGLFTLYCGGSGTPDYCGDGHPLNSTTQFCHNNETFDKCGGRTYNPDVQFCGQNELHDLCGGAEFDPAIRFCSGNIVIQKCNGHEFEPATEGCVHGNVMTKCGRNFYDYEVEFCYGGRHVFEKCSDPNFNYETFDPQNGCNGTPLLPTCDGQPYDPSILFCFYNEREDDFETAELCDDIDFDVNTHACVNGVLQPRTSEIQNYAVAIVSEGTGATGDGSYTAGTAITIFAGTPPENHVFVNWTTASAGVVFDDENESITTFTMPANDVTVTANFELLPKYTITYNGNDNTGGDVPIDDTEYFSGSEVTVLGEGNLVKTGYNFVGWNTQADGEGNSYAAGNTFNITENTTLYARWTDLPTYTVTVSRNVGTGASGSGNYWSGAEVQIDAGDDPVGYRFVNWTVVSGGVTLANANNRTATFTMSSSPVEVRANFELMTYTLTTNLSPTVGGSITRSPNQEIYEHGTTVTVVATAGENYRFTGWTDASMSTNPEVTIIMDGNKILTANFVRLYTVDVSSVGIDAVGDGVYAQGETVTISAGTPPLNHGFKNWTTTSAGVTFANANNSTTTFTMPDNAVIVTANFIKSHLNRNITYGSFVDERDGQTYYTVTIGTQTWMAENLNFTPTYGDSWCYNDSVAICDIFGRLYTWSTAMDLPVFCDTESCASMIQLTHRGICPEGWHLPNTDEWETLVNHVGSNPGSKLRSRIRWSNSSSGYIPGTDEFGFSALPGGCVGCYSQDFFAGGINGYWWTATEVTELSARHRYMNANSANVTRGFPNKIVGHSVRCVKN